MVSIAVGIILFDAGLGLNVSKLSGSVARVYRRLVSLGILVTWAVGTGAGADHYCDDDEDLAPGPR